MVVVLVVVVLVVVVVVLQYTNFAANRVLHASSHGNCATVMKNTLQKHFRQVSY